MHVILYSVKLMHVILYLDRQVLIHILLYLDYGAEEYSIACLMMVYVAVSLPRLARSDMAVFKASLEGHANNSHCLAKAVNSLASALFTIHGHGDVEERLKEFLAVCFRCSLISIILQMRL